MPKVNDLYLRVLRGGFFSADGIFLIQALGVWVAADREELKCLQLIIKFQRSHVRTFHYLII